MVAASVALAIIGLAAQHPATPSGGAGPAPAQRDAAPRSEVAMEMLKGSKVKFELLDSNGVEHKASLVRVDGANAVLRARGADYSIPVGQLWRFERPGDRRWDGALIGFGVGLGLAVLASAAEAAVFPGDAPTPPSADHSGALAVSLMCISTAVGYAIDAAHGGKHTVFVGSMTSAATRPPALTLHVSGQPHGRSLNVGYRLTF